MPDKNAKNAKTGVWLVVTNKGGYDEFLHAVFSGDDPVGAIEFQNHQGFGDIVWEPFGRVVEP